MYAAIDKEVGKSGARLLKTYFYEDANGTRFVLQEKLPPGTKSFADTVDGFLSGLVPHGEYDPYLRREMFAAEIDGRPLTDPKYRFWGVDTARLASVRANPEYQRFLNEMRSARAIADSPAASSVAQAYRDRGLLLTNTMAWHDADGMANVDFSWENGRVLPSGQIVWFDF